jgi:uncharacterized membrane protein (DUF4010 family)
MTEAEAAVRIGVAGLVGLAVGIEREWSGKASGPAARFAGVRTFLLVGTVGGVAGWLLDAGYVAAAAALVVAVGGLVVAAYVLAARRGAEAIDGTTEAAALLVLGIGILAGLGSLALASGVAAVSVLALGEKRVISDFIHRIGRTEMEAALQFAVLALVVLPLLPEGPIGPFGGVRPRSLWGVVLLFCGLNFAGYIARRAWGDARGYQVMGALGGLLSSTGVTLNFARQSRNEPGNADALAVGTVAACTVLVPRVLGIVLILNPALVAGTALGLAPILLAGVALIAVGRRHLRGGTPTGAPPIPANPLQLGAAIRMAIAFQLVLTLLSVINIRFGAAGVLASAAFLGSTDMDALTFGMSRLAFDAGMLPTAALALTLGVTVNSIVKTGIATALGAPAFRRLAVPGLLVLSAAGGAGFWLLYSGVPGRLIRP